MLVVAGSWSAEHFLRHHIGSESHCLLGQLNKILEISDLIRSRLKSAEVCTAKLPYTNVLYTNVRSLTRGSKKDELKMLIGNHKIDIIGISETWGKADILDIEMEIPGFKLYRKDRATINN